MGRDKVPSTRAAAMAAGATHYFTGKPCKRGHVALRLTKGACVECQKEDWQRAAPARAAYFAEYNASDAGKAAKRRYYATNREFVIARAQARPLEEKRRYRKRWKVDNPDQVRADVNARRRRHRHATPACLTRADRAAMRQLYQHAQVLTELTGERYAVDHIVPLRHPLVSGLHVPWNLQVVREATNAEKSNKLHFVIG